jgi:predicted nucleic acid-binding protein
MFSVVADTSPLQALYRGSETKKSRRLAGENKVPDLDLYSYFITKHVTAQDLVDAGATKASGGKNAQRYSWCGRFIDEPELETVVLAEKIGAWALVEDKHAVHCAKDRDITVIDTTFVLSDLGDRGLIDARDAAKRILATGFHSRNLTAGRGQASGEGSVTLRQIIEDFFVRFSNGVVALCRFLATWW